MFKINNKNSIRLVIICVIAISSLMFYTEAYCDASFFQKWYLNTENYFLNLTWEKAIKDIVALPKSIGWVSVGAIGSLYAFEGIWNARRLGSILLYKYTPLGHLDDGSGVIKSWLGFRNTAGPLKNVIDTVPYEEILPLFMARKYVFPYIFIKSNTDIINPSENQTNPVINNANLSNIPRVETNSIGVQADLSPTVITEQVERPVYIPVKEYRDRENLQTLDISVQALNVSAQDLKFSQNNQKTRDDLLAEINLLREHESAACLTLQKLSRNYETFKLAGVTDEQGFSLTPVKLKYLFFPKEESKLIKIYFDDLNYVALNKQSFSVKYPQIYLTLNTLTQTRHEYTGYRFSKDQIFEQYDSYVYFRYNETRTYFSYSFELDAPNCLIIEKSLQEKKTESYLLSKIEEIQSRSLETAQSNLDRLVSGLSEKIANEQRLINVETRDQGIQTANFDLNETVFDRISSFLEIRDETAFVVASHEGRNLPFNNMQIQSYSKTQEVIAVQTQETSVETQTDPSISENIGILGMSSVNSSIFQSMGALFSAALVWSVSHDFQTLDLMARSLLGFIHIPEYNQAFIAATQMSVVDLQMEYGFSLDDARKAYDSIEYANTMRTTGSLPSDLGSQLSDSNDYTDNAPKSNTLGWRDYLLIGTSIVVISGAIIYITQSIKNGTYTQEDNNITQGILSSFDAWEKQYIDKIRKL